MGKAKSAKNKLKSKNRRFSRNTSIKKSTAVIKTSLNKDIRQGNIIPGRIEYISSIFKKATINVQPTIEKLFKSLKISQNSGKKSLKNTTNSLADLQIIEQFKNVSLNTITEEELVTLKNLKKLSLADVKVHE